MGILDRHVFKRKTNYSLENKKASHIAFSCQQMAFPFYRLLPARLHSRMGRSVRIRPAKPLRRGQKPDPHKVNPRHDAHEQENFEHYLNPFENCFENLLLSPPINAMLMSGGKTGLLPFCYLAHVKQYTSDKLEDINARTMGELQERAFSFLLNTSIPIDALPSGALAPPKTKGKILECRKPKGVMH